MIRITTDIPKHLISTIITSNMDENLENEALEYKGFAVKIKRQGDLNVTRAQEIDLYRSTTRYPYREAKWIIHHRG